MRRPVLVWCHQQHHGNHRRPHKATQASRIRLWTRGLRRTFIGRCEEVDKCTMILAMWVILGAFDQPDMSLHITT